MKVLVKVLPKNQKPFFKVMYEDEIGMYAEEVKAVGWDLEIVGEVVE